MLHYVTLRFIMLHYVTLRDIMLHYFALHYITLHSNFLNSKTFPLTVDWSFNMSHIHVIKMTWGKHVHSCSYSKTTIQAELTYPFIKTSDPVKRVSLWCLPSSTLPLKRDENSVFRCIVENVFKKSQLLWLEINLYTLFFVYSKSQKRLFSVLCYFVII